MCCFANESMLPDLKAIWKECFDDENTYIEFLFSNQMRGRTTLENQLVYMKADRPVSMLIMIPGTLMLAKGSRKIYYIYGVATKKEHRGKGYAAKLLKYAYRLAQKEQAALVLVPASESLYAYYEKLGFATAFYHKTVSFDISLHMAESKEQVWTMQEANADTYGAIRKKEISRPGTVMWGEKEILYAYKENQFLGGKSYLILYHNKEYLCMCYAYKNCLYVRETTLPDELLHEVAYKIATNYQCQKVSVKLPVFCGSLGQKAASGMILPSSLKQSFQRGYLGLALD